MACSIASSKTSNTLEKDLDLLASVPSPSSSVSRQVSLVGSSGFKENSGKGDFDNLIMEPSHASLVNGTLVFLVLDSFLNTMLSLLQPKITIHSILSCPKSAGPLNGLLFEGCQIVKTDILGQLLSLSYCQRICRCETRTI